jgi:hypothetical protein
MFSSTLHSDISQRRWPENVADRSWTHLDWHWNIGDDCPRLYSNYRLASIAGSGSMACFCQRCSNYRSKHRRSSGRLASRCCGMALVIIGPSPCLIHNLVANRSQGLFSVKFRSSPSPSSLAPFTCPPSCLRLPKHHRPGRHLPAARCLESNPPCPLIQPTRVLQSSIASTSRAPLSSQPWFFPC